MKKLALTIAAAGLTAAAFAQGTVNWTGVAGNFVGQTNGTVYSSFETSQGSPTGGTVGNTLGNTAANDASLGFQGYYYELLVSSSAAAAPTTLAGLAAWSDTSLGATNSAASNGRIVQVAGLQNSVANNWAVGNTEGIILVGWSANLGSSWSTVYTELQNWGSDSIANAYFGVSSFASTTIGSANPGITVLGSGVINNAAANPEQLDLLGTVPEPGTMALAAIGGASLLLFRRKK